MGMTVGDKIDAANIRQRIRSYYGSNEWAVLYEVIDATGARHSRSADAVAMNTWPSRGLVVHGIEIKVSRYDWLEEKRRPEKASRIAAYCDYWWLASPANIVQAGEIPEAWGHYVPDDKGPGLKIAKAPQKLPDPKPLDRLFVASLLRNAGRADDYEVETLANRKIAHEREQDKQRVQMEIDNRTRHYAELKTAVETFEQHTGIKIHDRSWGWSLAPEHVANLVKIIEAIGVDGYDKAARVVETLRKSAEKIDEALKPFMQHAIVKDEVAPIDKLPKKKKGSLL